MSMNEHLDEFNSYVDRWGPDPSPGPFDHLRKPRKIARMATKNGQGMPGSRSKDERRIRREKRAQRATNRR